MKHFQGVVRRGSVWSGRGILLPDTPGEEQSPRQSVTLWSKGWVRCRGDLEPVGTAGWVAPCEPHPQERAEQGRAPSERKRAASGQCRHSSSGNWVPTNPLPGKRDIDGTG